MATQSVRPEATATIGPVIVVPAHDVDHPAQVVYSEGFESFPNASINPGGWVASASAGATVSTTARTQKPADPTHSGTARLFARATTATSVSAYVDITRSFTGLHIGRHYTVTAWSAAGGTAQIGVSGIGIGTGTVVVSDFYSLATYTFTATASSHSVYLRSTSTDTSHNAIWDDITVTGDAYTEHVADQYGDVAVPVSAGTLTIDDGWTPYVQASLSIPITDADLVEQIDPRDVQRVTITATEAVAGESRTFDLGLRERTIDHKNGTIEVVAASDEALLLDRCNVSTAVDTTPRTHATSLRAIVNWALAKIGASLVAGTADANLTPYWSLTNLLPNPNLAANITGYVAGSGGTIAHNAGADSAGGTGFLRATLSASLATVYFAPTSTTSGYAVTAGRTYVVSAAIRQNVAGGVAALFLQFVDASGNNIGTTSETGITLATGWNRATTIRTAPPGAVKVIPSATITGSASGRTVDFDRISLVEDTEGSAYFDGSTAPTGYTTAWTATANASTSTRTPVVARDRELLYWSPGQSLWDFLQPLLEATGLRLFCNELRQWHLVDPADYSVPGYVVVQSEFNATEGTDAITRNDDSWADAVVCIYRWDDENGLSQTAYDVAGDPSGKCVTREYDDTAFPGPGAAAYILGRLQGKGRTQDVTALTQMGATPGQSLTVTLPATLSQTGTISRVEFDLAQGLMTIGSRGLTDTYPGSWWAWDPSETWSEVDPGMTWDEA